MKNSRFIFYANLLLFLSMFPACTPQVTPTPFRPPTSVPPTQPLATTTIIPTITITASSTEVIPTQNIDEPCTNVLSFLDDVTVDDGTTFLPNTSIDKQWLIKNDGTCDWGATYQLKWVGGDPMGASTEQALYPARAGTQATLQIIFTAPAIVGEYESAWQAVDPDGNFFGDLVFIKIVVQ